MFLAGASRGEGEEGVRAESPPTELQEIAPGETFRYLERGVN